MLLEKKMVVVEWLERVAVGAHQRQCGEGACFNARLVHLALDALALCFGTMSGWHVQRSVTGALVSGGVCYKQ